MEVLQNKLLIPGNLKKGFPSSMRKKSHRVFYQELWPWWQDLYRFAYSLTKNISDTEDLVQETYLRAYRYLTSYKEGTNARAWLFTILKNRFINEYHRRQRQPITVHFEEDITSSSRTLTGRGRKKEELPDEEVGTFSDLMIKALYALPRRYRTILLLREVQEYQYKEIAEILSLPLGTVHSSLYRARRLLKENLSRQQCKGLR